MMEGFSWFKYMLSLLLVGCYLFLPQLGYPGHGLLGHFVYVFCHANIWHLAANLLCFWLIPCRLRIVSAYALSVLCSFLPCFVSEETLGMSGILFATVGMSWGVVGRFKDMVWRNKWFLLIPLFLPHVNALLHLYCLLGGYVFGRYVKGNDWL